MRILLDENLPGILARHLTGHDVRTVQRMRWAGIQNGTLLRLASDQFDVFVTMDRSLEHQQVIPSRLCVIVLRLQDNKPETVLPVAPDILNILSVLQPGTVAHIDPH